MKPLFTFIAVLGSALSASAQLELHTLRCSSNSLTMDMAFVASSALPEATAPNAKALLVVRARNAAGQSLLGGRRSQESQAYLALERSSKYESLRAYGRSRLNFYLQTKQDLEAELTVNRPAFYYYLGDPTGLEQQVSYVNGHRVNWSQCAFDSSQAVSVRGQIQSFSVKTLKAAISCPAANSQAENTLIMEKGAIYQETGVMDVCLNKVLNRELSYRGKNTKTINRDELKDYVSDLSAATMKGEFFEKESF